MKKKFWARKVAGFILIAALAVVVFGFVVMGLWNTVLVAVLPVHAVTFGQALGILVLSKILFGGGFRGRGGWRGGGSWREKMREKCAQMTPEEQEKFKQEWRNKCRRWGRDEDTKVE